ncbi:hypothetical protein LY76DRAFT_73177 [Colletotrichum caudatum]|nr:hypothetical protein LY76DRAFT_73177 [Colletotrichum caudatum]
MLDTILQPASQPASQPCVCERERERERERAPRGAEDSGCPCSRMLLPSRVRKK